LVRCIDVLGELNRLRTHWQRTPQSGRLLSNYSGESAVQTALKVSAALVVLVLLSVAVARLGAGSHPSGGGGYLGAERE
jgi:hypothetical protein